MHPEHFRSEYPGHSKSEPVSREFCLLENSKAYQVAVHIFNFWNPEKGSK